jgi:hypothetical protein
MKKTNIKYIILSMIVVIIAVVAVSLYNKTPEKTVARVDITTALVDEKKPQFEIYVDGSEAKEQQSGWMSQFGVQGYVIQKDDGVKDIELKALKNATINITLRGIWEKGSDDKAMERWVKYTSMTVNGEDVLKEPIDVWHDKPFVHTIKAKSGEEYKIHVEWTKSSK